MKRNAGIALLVLVAIALFVPPCTGQASSAVENSETFGMSNGKLWKQLPKDGRLVYLIGLLDAIKWKIQENGVSDEEYEKASQLEYAKGFSRADYIQVLDELYKQPENTLIPIAMAVKFFCTPKLTGTWKAADLEDLLIQIRTISNSDHTRPTSVIVPAAAPAAPAKP